MEDLLEIICSIIAAVFVMAFSILIIAFAFVLPFLPFIVAIKIIMWIL